MLSSTRSMLSRVRSSFRYRALKSEERGVAGLLGVPVKSLIGMAPESIVSRAASSTSLLLSARGRARRACARRVLSMSVTGRRRRPSTSSPRPGSGGNAEPAAGSGENASRCLDGRIAPPLSPVPRGHRMAGSVLLPMETVQDSVDDRREDDAHDNQEHQPGIKCVGPREELAGGSTRRVDRPHATQKHRGVQKGVHPGQLDQNVIPQHAQKERAGRDPGRQGRMAEHPREESASGDWRVMSLLVQGCAPFAWLPLRAMRGENRRPELRCRSMRRPGQRRRMSPVISAR